MMNQPADGGSASLPRRPRPHVPLCRGDRGERRARIVLFI